MKKLFGMLFMLLLMAMLSGVAMADSMEKGIGPVLGVSFDIDPTDIAPAGVATVPKGGTTIALISEEKDTGFSLDTMGLSFLETMPGIDYLPDIGGAQCRLKGKDLVA